MAAEEYLRLAWHADQDGRSGMRDALLTLAVAESGPNEAVVAERCRRRLITGRPEHWYASFATLGEALKHPQVAAALGELRAVYPLVRVRRLLLRNEARRGPFHRHAPPLARVVSDLVGEAPWSRYDSSDEAVHSLGESPSTETTPLTTFYLTLLLAMAILLATALEPSQRDTKAA